MSKRTKKFYRPGTLEAKGTKISLKTQPYINGTVFDTEDPISAFHRLLVSMKTIIDEYERFREIPGSENIPSSLDLNTGITGQLKLLLDFLIQSPIEIILKEQIVNNDILADLVGPSLNTTAGGETTNATN